MPVLEEAQETQKDIAFVFVNQGKARRRLTASWMSMD